MSESQTTMHTYTIKTPRSVFMISAAIAMKVPMTPFKTRVWPTAATRRSRQHRRGVRRSLSGGTPSMCHLLESFLIWFRNGRAGSVFRTVSCGIPSISPQSHRVGLVALIWAPWRGERGVPQNDHSNVRAVGLSTKSFLVSLITPEPIISCAFSAKPVTPCIVLYSTSA